MTLISCWGTTQVNVSKCCTTFYCHGTCRFWGWAKAPSKVFFKDRFRCSFIQSFNFFLFLYQENEKQMQGLKSWTKANVPSATFLMKEFKAFLPAPDQTLNLLQAQPWYILESRVEKNGRYTTLLLVSSWYSNGGKQQKLLWQVVSSCFPTWSQHL